MLTEKTSRLPEVDPASGFIGPRRVIDCDHRRGCHCHYRFGYLCWDSTCMDLACDIVDAFYALVGTPEEKAWVAWVLEDKLLLADK